MSRHPFLKIHAFCLRHRIRLLVASSLLTAAAGLALWFLRYDKTLDSMLPEGGSIPRVMEVLRDASLSSKIAISVGCASTNVTSHELIGEADGLAAALGESPLVAHAMSDFSRVVHADDMALFFQAAPEILGEDALRTLAGELSPDGVRAALRQRYMQLLKPEGSFLAAAVRADPLGIRWKIADRLQTVMSSFGYEARMEDGHLLSRDGRHCLVVIETPISPTDNVRAAKLSQLLDEKIARLPSGFSADVICGHLHTVSNEKTIKWDVAMTNTVASIAFLLLFFVVFRDPRAVFTIIAIPVAASLIAVPLTALLFGKVSLIVIGLGSVVAGVSIDYAMHVYVAARRSANAGEALQHVALPVSVGAFTTCGMFAAFFASSVPGYRQLAAFSILSILAALLFALTVFPHFVKPGSAGLAVQPDEGSVPSKAPGRNILVVWAILFAFCLWEGRRVGFDSDILRMDGTEKAIRAAEQRFYATWGEGDTNQAIVVCEGKTAEDAQRASDGILSAARAAGVKKLDGAALSMLWPSRQTRSENLARWQAFWDAGRVERLRGLLDQEGVAFGFATNAFDPFFESLAATPAVHESDVTNGVLDRLRSQFLQPKGAGWQSLSFYPDEAAVRDVVRAADGPERRVTMVSPMALAADLSRLYGADVMKISAFAVALIVIVTFIMVRSVKITLISLVPSASAVAALLAVLCLTGQKLNMANIFAGIVVFGLNLDYGFIMMHSYRHELGEDSRTSVHISAITTIIGTAALLFARHPVLLAMGMTLTIGILAGYVTAVWVVPALYGIWGAPGGSGKTSGARTVLGALFLAALMTAGCATLQWTPPPRDVQAPDPSKAREFMRRNAPVRLQMVNSVLFEFRGRKLSGLGFLETDAVTRSFGLACLSPTGVTLFDVGGSNGIARCRFAQEAFTNRGDFASNLARDIEKMFFALEPPADAIQSAEPGAVVFTRTDGNERMEWVAGVEGRLLEKRYFDRRRLVSRVGYYDFRETEGKLLPGRIVFHNLKYGYGLTVIARELRRCE